MNEEEIAMHIEEINKMSHIEMARLQRFAPFDHIYFDPNLPLYAVFRDRYNKFGGMTTEISKQLGWD